MGRESYLLHLPEFLMVAAALPVFIAFKIWKRRHDPDPSAQLQRPQFHGHSAIWISSMTLFVILIFRLLEGILRSHVSSSFTEELYVPLLFSLFAVPVSLLLYHNAERAYSLPWFGVCVGYWLAVSAFTCVRLVTLPLLRQNVLVVFLSAELAAEVILFSIGCRILSSWRSLRGVKWEQRDPSVKFEHPFASLLSKSTWHWITGLLAHGYRNVLTIKDLGKLPESEYSENNFKALKSIYDDEKKRALVANRSPSLWRAYWRAYWPMIVLGGFFKLLADQLMYLPPILLDYMVQYVIHETRSSNNATNDSLDASVESLTFESYFSNGYILAIIAFLATILQAALMQNHFFLSVRQGTRCKAAVQALVYDKSLRLSTFGLNEGKMTTGQIMNHMSVDPLNIFFLFYLFHSVWSLPIQILFGFVLLYYELGLCALVSGLLIVVMIPVQYCIGHRLSHYQKLVMEQADLRLKKVNEVFQNIKFIKLCAMENAFIDSILATRTKELQYLLGAAVCRIGSIMVTDGIPVCATVMTFCLYPYFEDVPLSASKVFTVLAIFNIFTLPLFIITFVINTLTHAVVSNNRIQRFLAAPEVEPEETEKEFVENEEENAEVRFHPTNGFRCPPVITVTHDEDTENTSLCRDASPSPQVQKRLSNDVAFEVIEGQFAWDTDGNDAILKGINVTIPKGKLTLVVGEVGAGKSSLLSALTGEMVTMSGRISQHGHLKVAYVGQKAWLMNATVRENVLFGSDFDSGKYEDVVEKSALAPDIEILVAGDQTQIGEKGVTLSGGQKQRVNLARALYSDADITLLDDPLSALDAQVGSHVFEEAIKKFLVRDQRKTAVLVTHHVHYLPNADWIIFMDNGKVTFQGSFQSLQTNAPELYTSWKNSLNQPRKDKHDEKPHKNTVIQCQSDLVISAGPRSASSLASLSCPSLFDEEEVIEKMMPLNGENTKHVDTKNPDESDLGRLIEDEDQESGIVALKYYAAYARAAGLGLFFVPLFFYVLRQVLRMGGDFWLAEWMEMAQWLDDQPMNSSSVSENLPTVEYYSSVYAGIQGVALITLTLCILTLEVMALVTARNLQASMLRNLLAAPVRFFDTTPIGRIINRFAGDTQTIDERLVVAFDQVLFCVLYVLGGIIVNAVSNAYFIIPLFPVFGLFFMIQRFYIASSRELQRLDNVSRSPVLSHFSETLNGLSTIRAYRDQERFQRTNWLNIDTNNTALLFLQTANVWMGIRLDFLGGAIVLAASICSITAGIHGSISPSVVGLGISYAIVISTFINWAMRGISETEMYFNSVERVTHYMSIPTEVTEVIEGDSTDFSNWPSHGRITFEDLSARYDKNLDPALRNISLNIAPGEKIGICGRTGSGKSSLTLCLFRMVDLYQGRILIDDVDICQIPLSRLRSQVAIIPQDPVLFFGSVRYNLDSTNKRTDAELWNALEIAQLKPVIQALPNQLDTLITEGGENLSVGQRQLFCLARAFLRHSKILIMDEATSSIDIATDRLIQTVVHSAFERSTIITIAHRVSSILQCDTILVLSNGEIVERGSPVELQGDPHSAFSALLQQNKM